MNMLIKLTPGGADKEVKLNYLNVCIDFSCSSNFGRPLWYHNQIECTVYVWAFRPKLFKTDRVLCSVLQSYCGACDGVQDEADVCSGGTGLESRPAGWLFSQNVADISQTPWINALIQP